MLLKIKSELRTANIFSVGVNAVSLTTQPVCDTAFSFSEIQYYYDGTNHKYKLPSFLFRFVLFLAAIIKLIAVLFKRIFQVINVIWEMAPRGIFYFLSLINFFLFHYSLSTTEWLMISREEEDNLPFFSTNRPLFSLYVQQD